VVHEKKQNLARFQRIKKFVILDKELTIEDNDLTPTLKVKRKVVTEKYRKELDELYEAEDLEAQETAEVDA
jgi:long-chain acyl-CoA synthetase